MGEGRTYAHNSMVGIMVAAWDMVELGENDTPFDQPLNDRQRSLFEGLLAERKADIESGVSTKDEVFNWYVPNDEDLYD